VAVVLPNLSAAGTVRLTGGNTEVPSYSLGFVPVWPAGQTAETMEGLKPTFVAVIPAELAPLRYWRVEINDPTNADGYVDVGRLVVAGGWQPSINMSNGARIGLVDPTEVQEGDGAAFFNERPIRRTLDFDISMLPEDEAMARGFDMQRIAGTAGQMFFVFDPADTIHMHRRAFLCRLRTLSAVEYPYFGRGSIPFQLVEEL
jgi:hypothetical protein